MDRNIEVLALDVMKRFDVFLRGITAFFTGKIEADNSTRTKIDGQLRHLKRLVPIAHGADD